MRTVSSKKKIILSSLTVLLTFVAFLLLFSSLWMYRTWPHMKMDELMYQIGSPLEGTITDFYIQFTVQAFIPALFISMFVASIIHYSSHRKHVKKLILLVNAACIAATAVTFNSKLNVLAYLKNENTDSIFIEENYADSSETELTFPEKKRNLISIYLESMEMTYSDTENGGAFSENIIPNLTALSEENENFSGDAHLNGAVSTSRTTWTMGGLFATTSGLPLKIDIDGNKMDTQNHFFRNITTLGDILDRNGYRQVFACGSDATFVGRQLYFTEHGNYEIHDLNYRRSTGDLPKDYYVWWGFEDSKLIDFAKNDLAELSASDQPFNYTMLTVDTHFEDGYVCDQCEDQHDGNQYANVMSCSDRRIAEFIEWCRQQPWHENTTIVITGDHPTMDKDFCDAVPSDYQRKVLVSYINAAPVTNASTGNRLYTTLDEFPTTVSALGVDIKGHRLGLGTDLFSGEQTLIERTGLEMINTEFNRHSQFMRNLADVTITDENRKPEATAEPEEGD